MSCEEKRKWAFMLEEGQQTSPVKGQVVNTLGFVAMWLCAATTQLCHCSMKAATGYDK